MADATNGGMLYHEVQASNLSAVHCLNALLQGPFFDETDLAAIAADVDREERRVTDRGGGEPLSDFVAQDSHNVSTAGDVSLQVLQQALSLWNLQVIPVNSNVDHDPERENAFICHLHGHWFCVRNVNGEWYNFNSLYAAPGHLSKFYLSAFLDTRKGSGWSVFLVRGNLPVECPMTMSNSFGQWLTPEGAGMITDDNGESHASQQRQDPDPLSCYPQQAEQHLHAAAVSDSIIDWIERATEETQTKGASPGLSAVGSQSDVMKTEAASMADTSSTLHAAAVADGEIQPTRASAGFSAAGSQSDVMKTEAASMADTSPTLHAAAVADGEIQAMRASPGLSAAGSQSDVVKTEAASMADTSPTPGSGVIPEGGPATESSDSEGPLADGGETTDSEDMVLSDGELNQRLLSLFVLANRANKTSVSRGVERVPIEVLGRQFGIEELIEAAMSDDDIVVELLRGISAGTRGDGGKSSS